MLSLAVGVRPPLPASSHCSGASGSDAASTAYTWTSARVMDVITCAAGIKSKADDYLLHESRRQGWSRFRSDHKSLQRVRCCSQRLHATPCCRMEQKVRVGHVRERSSLPQHHLDLEWLSTAQRWC